MVRVLSTEHDTEGQVPARTEADTLAAHAALLNYRRAMEGAGGGYECAGCSYTSPEPGRCPRCVASPLVPAASLHGDAQAKERRLAAMKARNAQEAPVVAQHGRNPRRKGGAS